MECVCIQLQAARRLALVGLLAVGASAFAPATVLAQPASNLPASDAPRQDTTSRPGGHTDQPKVTPGQTGPTDSAQTVKDSVYAAMFKALFTVFVVAVVLESALAVIFNWRPFLLYFDGRGVRTIISLGFAWTVAWLLQLNLLDELYSANSPGSARGTDGVGLFITALVIAGGSAGVNNLLTALGFRDVTRPVQVVAKPPQDHAWLSVRLTRARVVGRVRVLVQKDGEAAQVVGMILGQRSPPGPLRWFVRDSMRFPTAAGLALEGDRTYAVRVEGEDSAGATQQKTWGSFPIAKGAIIDIELTV